MATLNDRAGQRPFGPGRGPRRNRRLAAVDAAGLPAGLPRMQPHARADRKSKQLLAEEEEKKKSRRRSSPFEAGEPESLPTRSLAAHGMCKPGHWIGQTWYDLKSNLGDFQGEIQTEAVDSKIARVQFARGAVPIVRRAASVAGQRAGEDPRVDHLCAAEGRKRELQAGHVAARHDH